MPTEKTITDHSSECFSCWQSGSWQMSSASLHPCHSESRLFHHWLDVLEVSRSSTWHPSHAPPAPTITILHCAVITLHPRTLPSVLWHSAICRVKIWLRNTTSRKRLTHLGLIRTSRNISQKLDTKADKGGQWLHWQCQSIFGIFKSF